MATSELQQRLRAAVEGRRAHFSAAALPGSDAIRRLAESGPGRPWEGLEPLQQFLLFELSPAVAARAGDAAAPAYCAALAGLPGDWWGLPGSRETPAARRLAALGTAAAGCLAGLLDDETPLRFHSGEENTLARRYQLTVADQAAAFLAAALGHAYDWRADPATRRAQRAGLQRTTSA
jgi:hypothetical protein